MNNSNQTPINSGLSAATESADIVKGINLTGRTAIVTGGYSGLGRVVAKSLAGVGAKVIVPARDVARAKEALSGTNGTEVRNMDLQDAGSIERFATDFLSSGQDLHFLINCAGIMAPPLKRDTRGYESQFSTNHLGHFELAVRLWPALRRAGGARIVSVSSWGHRFSDVDYQDWNFEKKEYNPWAGYGQSKTANILFAVAADARGKADGVRTFSLHPGTILDTNLSKYVPSETLIGFGVLDKQGNPILDPKRGLKTESQGAATILWCAVSQQLNGLGGLYAENCDIAPIGEAKASWSIEDSMVMNGVMPYAVDSANAERLWELSVRLTGVALDEQQKFLPI